MWRRAALFVPLCAVFFLFAVVPLHSHDPITTKLTWTQEISRIVYKRCASCHRDGGAAFSLVKYEEARPWAKAIRDQVRMRTMPPWGAVKGIGEFANDPSLSDPEIDMLVMWVEGGAPEGELKYLPAPPLPVSGFPEPKFPRELRVATTWKASSAVRLAAVAGSDLRKGGSLEVWISRVDGGVERLLWLKDYQAIFPRQFVLREPVTVRTGDVVHVTAPAKLSFVPANAR